MTLLLRYQVLHEYEVEDDQTEVYWIKYKHIVQAQIAKRHLDEYMFDSKLVDVSYALQHESIADTREKLMERKKIVEEKTQAGYYECNQFLTKY